MDVVDMANDRVELVERIGLEQSRKALGVRELLPMGACHWCNETLPRSDQIFCGADCAGDYAKSRIRNGKPTKGAT